MKPLIKLLFSFLIIAPSQEALAAACCGGGFAAPSIIAGDDKAQMSLSSSYSDITTDVYTNGLWKKRDNIENIQGLRIEGAHLISDRWQVGLSVPFFKRSRADQNSSGAGDLTSSVGYEYLPDWDYNPFRPKGIGFLQLTIPTGKSIYESENQYALDSRGRGFWALGAGTLLTKTWSRFDGFASLEAHRSFHKKVSQGTLEPGWGHNLGFGTGYNTTDFRFGGSLIWSQEDAVDLEGTQNSSGAAQRFTTASLQTSYMANEEFAATLAYADQTVIGNPTNTSLGKTLSLQLQMRWAR